MSIPLLIAITPPNEIENNIVSLRKLISKITSQNSYGLHEPHITLFVNSFQNFSDVEEKVISIAKRNKRFSVSIEGLHTFTFDPIMKSYTISYKLKKTPALAKIQKKIVDKVNPLRTDDQVKWLLQKNPHQSKENMKNIRKYGYPFSPKEWVFHASIASVPKEDHNKIWKKIKQYDLTKTWQVKYISIFVHLGDDGFKLFRKYKLQ